MPQREQLRHEEVGRYELAESPRVRILSGREGVLSGKGVAVAAGGLTVETLEDWARAGAHWRVIHHGERRAIVELQQCTGEPVERLESDDPAVIAYLEGVECDLDLTTTDGDGNG